MIEPVSRMLAHPLFGLTVTLAAYAVASALWRRTGSPLLHPVLVATVLVGVLLVVTHLPYDDYLDQTYVLNQALGLIIVLLAVPLYRQFELIKSAGFPLGCALLAGSFIAIFSSLLIPAVSGATNQFLATLVPRSVTAAVAVELSTELGGVASLTAVIVISTGIFGAIMGPKILEFVGVEDERAAGFALGLASHAIGTARAFQISEVAGAFASVGMILNALLTIILAPLMLALVIG